MHDAGLSIEELEREEEDSFYAKNNLLFKDRSANKTPLAMRKAKRRKANKAARKSQKQNRK